ncbi:hypothetical protein EDEG_03574, partial [Edhazardia aedis USNM 41457]
QLLKFVYTENEDTQYILKYMRKLIKNQKKNDFIFYNSDFAVFSTDSDDIARLKLDILLFDADDVTITEIDNCFKLRKLPLDCLYIKIKFDILDLEMLKYNLNNDLKSTLELIQNCNIISESWKELILTEIDKIRMPRKYHHLVLNLLQNIIKNQNDYEAVKNIVEVIRKKSKRDDLKNIPFYIHMYYKNILSSSQLDEIFRDTDLGRQILFKISNNTDNSQNNTCFSAINDASCKTSSKKIKKIINSYISLKQKNNKRKVTSIKVNKYTSEKYLKKYDHINEKYVEKILYDWDESEFSVSIIYKSDGIFLEFKRIEIPLKCTVQNIFSEKQIEKACSVKLISLCENFVDKTLSVQIENKTRIFKIYLKDLIIPFQCEMGYFNLNFSEIKHYEIIDEKFFLKDTFFLDTNMFAFNLLQNEFFGIIMSGQAVLKSRNRLFFRKMVESIDSYENTTY